jgi:hypothetical protein
MDPIPCFHPILPLVEVEEAHLALLCKTAIMVDLEVEEAQVALLQHTQKEQEVLEILHLRPLLREIMEEMGQMEPLLLVAEVEQEQQEPRRLGYLEEMAEMDCLPP